MWLLDCVFPGLTFLKYNKCMKENDRKNVNSSMGFFGWLTLLFIGLKLTNYITWDWVWVLSPLWVPFTLMIGILILLKILVKSDKKTNK